MSLKLKALLQLVGLVAASIAGAEFVYFITTYVPKETLMNVLQGGLIGGLLYLCYGLILSRLEYQEKIKEIENK